MQEVNWGVCSETAPARGWGKGSWAEGAARQVQEGPRAPPGLGRPFRVILDGRGAQASVSPQRQVTGGLPPVGDTKPWAR